MHKMPQSKCKKPILQILIQNRLLTFSIYLSYLLYALHCYLYYCTVYTLIIIFFDFAFLLSNHFDTLYHERMSAHCYLCDIFALLPNMHFCAFTLMRIVNGERLLQTPMPVTISILESSCSKDAILVSHGKVCNRIGQGIHVF